VISHPSRRQAAAGPGADRRRALGALAAAAAAVLGAGTAPPAAEVGAKRKRGKRGCRGNRVAIDGRCAPPRNAACEASPICDPFNVADDQTGQAAACMHTAGGDLCDVAYVCRTNADCPADELCSKVACGDGFFRCQRMCGDRAVVGAPA
jgi:hypothetical protein